jgi:hypothetical protein
MPKLAVGATGLSSAKLRARQDRASDEEASATPKTLT